MSHWAEVDKNNIVLRVLVGDNNDPAGATTPPPPLPHFYLCLL